jgi:hypothetical protein
LLILGRSDQVFIGGIIVLGFAGGLAQTATAAACEIVPNKYRPVAIAFLEMAIAPTGLSSVKSRSPYADGLQDIWPAQHLRTS